MQSGTSEEIFLENKLPPDPINEFQVFDSDSSDSEEQQPANSPGNPKRAAEPRARRQHSQSEEMEDRSSSFDAPRSARMNASNQHLQVSNPNLPDGQEAVAKCRRRSLCKAEGVTPAPSQNSRLHLTWPDSPGNRVSLCVAKR